MDFFQIICFKESKNMAAEKNIRVMLNFCKSCTINKREKIILQLLLLKVCESFLFRQGKKAFSTLWSVQVFFGFQIREDQINTLYEKQIYFSTCR